MKSKIHFALLLLSFSLAGTRSQAAIEPVAAPPGHPESTGIAMTAGGVSVPVWQVKLNKRHSEVFEVASFTFNTPASVVLRVDQPAEKIDILPAGYGVKPRVSGNSIQFEINRPRHFYIQIPGRKPLLLFADAPSQFPEPKPGPDTFDVVGRFHADPSGKTESTAAIQQAIDQATLRGGTVLVPKGEFRSKALALKSNVRLHLTAGAALKFVDVIDEGMAFDKRQGKGLYFLNADNARNVSVTGEGLLDCNGETVHGSDKKRRLVSAFHSAQVTGLTLDGITIIDSSSWTVVPAFSRQVRIHNIKIVNSLMLYENDGIDPLSCQEVLVDHCFVLATDDAFCPKPGGVGTHGGGAKPGPAMEMRDVVFNDCVGWTRAAGFKLGRQSSTPALNIVCKNSHILASSRGCVIDHDGGTAPFRNILFQDITQEGYCKSAPIWIETRDPGPTSEVTFERIQVNTDTNPSVHMDGKDDVNCVSQVRLIDCTVHGQPATEGKSSPLRMSPLKFVKDIKITTSREGSRSPALTLTTVWGTHLLNSKAGAPVPVKPAVLATDSENRPVPGVEVTFSVAAGAGSVTRASVVTDSNGIATLGGWTLDKTPGNNELVARTKPGAASYVIFRTQGAAGLLSKFSLKQIGAE